MKDQVISLETAKLAKEKGFNWKVYKYHGGPFGARSYGIDSDKFNNLEAEYYYSAPTQSLLQKWLREEHSHHIYITDWDGDWMWNHQWILGSCNGKSMGGYKSHELALEDGLLEALKLINNE